MTTTLFYGLFSFKTFQSLIKYLAKAERDKLTEYFDTYTQQVQCDYDFLLEKAREEQERKAQAVQINEEEHEQERKTYYEK